MSTATVTNVSLSGWDREVVNRDARCPALVIAWSAEEPHRVGEVALVSSSRPQLLGRGDPDCQSDESPLRFVRQRPDGQKTQAGLKGRGISRRQLLINRDGDSLNVRQVGRCELSTSGRVCDEARVEQGDTIVLKNQLVLVCVERPAQAAAMRHGDTGVCPNFGRPDIFGMVGESEIAWQWRDTVRFFADAGRHVLVMGESGTGKELTARAIHAIAERGNLVTRNASTLPEGLIDAELFGNVKNYPNPGTPERVGLIGAADGGVLFLDEIGELNQTLQTHLLRVLDGGDYKRLGEAEARTSRFRFIGATNREPEALKHDLLARLPLRLTVPGLDERRDDIGLLIAHLARRAARKSPAVAERFGDSPRIAPELVDTLVRHRYRHHVRELDTLLWQAIGAAEGNFIGLSSEIAKATTETKPALELGAQAVEAALREAGGNRAKAASALGISRFALYRRLKKLES